LIVIDALIAIGITLAIELAGLVAMGALLLVLALLADWLY